MIWGYVIKHVVASAGREDRDRAGSMLPSTQQTAYALGAALTGITANALGFERMTHAEEFRTAAFWLFGGFVLPARSPTGRSFDVHVAPRPESNAVAAPASVLCAQRTAASITGCGPLGRRTVASRCVGPGVLARERQGINRRSP